MQQLIKLFKYYLMKRKLKVTFRDQQSQPAIFRLTNTDGVEFFRGRLKTNEGLNAINLAVKSYTGVMNISIEAENRCWQKTVILK